MFDKILAVYGLLISTIACLWPMRSKIRTCCRFIDNYSSDGNLDSICEFNIVNAGSKAITIVTISCVFKELKDVYPARSKALHPVLLNQGEFVAHQIDYTYFNDLIDSKKEIKIRLEITDSLNKKHKTRWIKLKQVHRNYCYIIGTDVNPKACPYVPAKEGYEYKVA